MLPLCLCPNICRLGRWTVTAPGLWSAMGVARPLIPTPPGSTGIRTPPATQANAGGDETQFQRDFVRPSRVVHRRISQAIQDGVPRI